VAEAVMSRENILHRVRTALGRTAGQGAADAPPVRLRAPSADPEARLAEFLRNVAALGGKAHRAASPAEARDYVRAALAGRTAVASNAPLLAECGIAELDGVQSGFTEEAALRACCATAGAGITSADYALADTGSLVLLSSHDEARLISLLPPVHIAIVPAGRVLSGLDELLTMVPDPAARSSSMVLITGPSRTADIEQILVRGVHGPRELHVVVAG
jgi:L-lactate dehydrogenase complex protein LldG